MTDYVESAPELIGSLDMTLENEPQPTTEPLADLAVPAPQVPDSVIKKVLFEEYGLGGSWTPLLSERDQNLRVRSDAGGEYVFKIASGAEDMATTELQARVLEHLESRRCSVQTPKIVRTRSGEVLATIQDQGDEYQCRLVTFVAGAPQSSLPQSEPLAEHLGQSTVALLDALEGFEFNTERPALLWDLQQTPMLKELLEYVADGALRDAVARAIGDYEQRVAPVMSTLDSRVIHGDLNPDNVVCDNDGLVAGVIDFGDMVEAPRVCELAIAAAYQRGSSSDPLQFIRAYLLGAGRGLSLQSEEANLIYDLIRARLTSSITILHWRSAERGEGDEYARRSLDTERSAGTFLLALDALGRDAANAQISSSLGI